MPTLKRYFVVFLLTFFIMSPLLPQEKKTPGCFYTRDRALADLQRNTAKILVQGGFAPIVYPTDKVFFKKYKISYYVFGCVAPEKAECLNDYNRTIFDYLDKNFDRSWRREVRNDAIGLRR